MLKLIKDPVFGNTVLSDVEAAILEMPVFNRLHHLMQNGLAYRVFPSNTTSRFEHSIGVMQTAGDMYCRSLANALARTRKRFLRQAWNTVLAPEHLSSGSGEDPLPAQNGAHLLKSIEKLVGTEFLNHHPGLGITCPDARLRVAHALLLQAVRLAGMLHDVGHFPCSHLFEDAVRLMRSHGMPAALKCYLDKIHQSMTVLAPHMQHTDLHEQAGYLIARAILGQLQRRLVCPENDVLADALLKRLELATLRILGWKQTASQACTVTGALSELLSGDLDADRLDFVLRDGSRTGLVNASGDVDRICKMMCLVDTGSGFRFCPAIQTLNDVQQCLLDRVRLYQYLYSHHRVWRLENALKSAIRFMLNHQGAPKKQLMQLFADLHLLAVADHPAAAEPVLHRIACRTDHWLLELARQAASLMNPDELDQIQEVLTGRKTWCSLWKREFEYRDFLIRAARFWLRHDKHMVKRLHQFFHARTHQTDFTPFADPAREADKLAALVSANPNAVDDDATLAWLGSLGVRVVIAMAEPALICRHGLADAMICPTRYRPGVHSLCMVDIKHQDRTCRRFADLSASMRYLERICERGIAMHVFVRKNCDPSDTMNKLATSLLAILRTVCRKPTAPKRKQSPARE